MTKHLFVGLIIAAASALAACGGGASSGNVNLPPTSTITPHSSPSPTPTPVPATPTPTPTPAPAVAPSVVQWSSSDAFAQQNFSISMPAAAAVGDVLVVALWNNGQTDGSANTYTPPDGWTQIDSNPGYYATYQAFAHVVTASDSNDYVFTPLAAVRQTVWIAADVSGASGTSPVDQTANSYIDGTSATFSTPILTPSHASELALAFDMPIPTTSVTWTNSSDWTVGTGPTYMWNGQALYQTEAAATPVVQSSALSANAAGFSALVLLNPAGI